MLHRSAIPKYWIWFHYLSIFKYPYEAIMHNEFASQKGVIWYNNMDSHMVLSSLSMGKVRMWACVVPMIVFAVVYRLFFYVSLKPALKFPAATVAANCTRFTCNDD